MSDLLPKKFAWKDGEVDDQGRFEPPSYWRPEAIYQRITAPARDFAEWFRNLSDAFGLEFVLFVIFGEHLLKGFLLGLLIIENLAYLHLQVGASTKVALLAVSNSCWALKPLIGLISDSVVLGGFRRTPWVIITSAMASIGYSCIFLLGESLGPTLLCLCFFVVRLQVAWTDLMVEAAYTEKMRDHPDRASDIVAWVWMGISVATVGGVLVTGPGLDLLGPFSMAGVALPFSAAVIIPATLGWMGEKSQSQTKFGVDWGLIDEQHNLFMCTVFLATVVIGGSVVAVSDVSNSVRAAFAIGSSAVVAGAGMNFLPEGIWKPMVFMMLSSAMTINTSGFVDNFYLDAATPEESAITGYPVCENCPHFSNSFYVTTVGVCDALFMLVGSWLFNRTMSHWTYRRALTVTQLLCTVTSLVDIVQFQRWNRHWGIPDEAFMLGKHAVQNTCGMLNYMPTTILISQLCPPGVESTVFALLAGFANFGGGVSQYLGAWVLERLGLSEIGNGEVDDFSNAWKACVISAFAPMVVLMLMPALLPDARISDPLQKKASNTDTGASSSSTGMFKAKHVDQDSKAAEEGLGLGKGDGKWYGGNPDEQPRGWARMARFCFW